LILNIQQTFTETFSSKLYLTFCCLLAAILENGRHGRQGAAGRWLHIQICSQYIGLPLCQIWFFYQKVHNRLAYPLHYCQNTEFIIFSEGDLITDDSSFCSQIF